MAQVIQLDTRRGPARCQATTASGRRCRNVALDGGFCRVHQPPAPAERIGPLDAETVREAIRFLGRRLTGQYDIDEFGFDAEITEKVFAPLARPVYRHYWRVEWRDVENVPADEVEVTDTTSDAVAGCDTWTWIGPEGLPAVRACGPGVKERAGWPAQR